MDIFRPEGVLWDMDGTLLRDRAVLSSGIEMNLHGISIATALSAVGTRWNIEELAIITPETYPYESDCQLAPELTIPFIVATSLNRMRIGDRYARLDMLRLVAEIVEGKNTVYPEILLEHATPMPGSAEIVHALDELGIPQGVVSGGMWHNIDSSLEIIGVSDIIHGDRRVTFESTKKHKPHAAPFLAGFRTLGLDESQIPTVAGVENDKRGVQSIRRAGLHAVAVTTEITAAEFNDVAEDVRPHFVADNLRQVAEHFGLDLAA